MLYRHGWVALLVLLFCATLNHDTGSAQGEALAGRLAALISEADLGDGVGVHVVDVTSGRQIFDHQGSVARNPASNMKLVTAAAALLRLGPGHQMMTGLYGRVTDGVVDTLVLRGFGDPTTRMSDLVELCERLQDRGVRTVRNIVVDNSYFDDQLLPPAFDQQPNETAAFRAPISAAPIERNAYVINVLPAAAAGEPARVRLAAAGYFVVDSQVTTAPDGEPRVVAVQRARDDGQMNLRLRGSVPVGGLPSSFRRRVEDPIGYAGHALAEALERTGIRGTRRVQQGRPPEGLALLASRYSPTMSQLLHAVGKDSDNFVAEMVMKVMAAEDRRPGTSAHGAEILQAVLAEAGVPAGQATVVNGSGLFNGNLIAPAHLTAIMRHVYMNPAVRDEYLAHLAIAGQDGTMHERLSDLPARGIVRAKTGTLNDVISLSGYVLGPNNGQVLAFSVIINGARGRQHQARTLSDDLVRAMASHLYPR